MRIASTCIVLLVFVFALGGCATVTITSDPSNAEVIYSPTGTPPWLPWPPQASTPATTPARKWLRPDPFYFVRVRKDGYYLPPPQFLDMGVWRRQEVRFQLEPTPELFARQQRARGLVLFHGEWVKPEEHNLVEYQGTWITAADKSKLEQQAKGLVFHDALQRWMTPQERERLDAEERRAKGLILVKGQWMTPLEADIQTLIDREAERTLASTVTYELRIERIGPVFTSGTELRVTDLSGHLLEALLSGPQSRRAQVIPYNTVTIQSLPGTYTLVVRQADARPTGLVGVSKVRLAAKNRYSATYRGGPQTTRFPLILPGTKESKVEPPESKVIPPAAVVPPPATLSALLPGGTDRATSGSVERQSNKALPPSR